jgi:hypothetical protein
MKRLLDTVNMTSRQVIQKGQMIQTGDVMITHAGNPLHEIQMGSHQASLTLLLVKGGTIASVMLCQEELFHRDAEYQDVTKRTRTKGNPNILAFPTSEFGLCSCRILVCPP